MDLIRTGKNTVIRSTAALPTEYNAFLWTAGNALRLDTFMRAETPNPIQV